MPERTEKYDPFSGLPWYIKAIAIVGVPSLISIGLVWNNEIQLIRKVEDTQTVVERMKIDYDTHDKYVRDTFNELTKQGKENKRLLQLVCYGVVKDSRKEDCFKE